MLASFHVLGMNPFPSGIADASWTWNAVPPEHLHALQHALEPCLRQSYLDEGTPLAYLLWLKAGGPPFAQAGVPSSPLVFLARLGLAKVRRGDTGFSPPVRAALLEMLEKGLSPWATAGDTPPTDAMASSSLHHLLPLAVLVGDACIVERCLQHPDAPPVAVWETMTVPVALRREIPLAHACLLYQHTACADLLVKAGANQDLRDSHGWPAVSWFEPHHAFQSMEKQVELFKAWFLPDASKAFWSGVRGRSTLGLTACKTLVKDLRTFFVPLQAPPVSGDMPSSVLKNSLHVANIKTPAYSETLAFLFPTPIQAGETYELLKRVDQPFVLKESPFPEIVRLLEQDVHVETAGMHKGAWTWVAALCAQWIFFEDLQKVFKREEHRTGLRVLFGQLTQFLDTHLASLTASERTDWHQCPLAFGTTQGGWLALARLVSQEGATCALAQPDVTITEALKVCQALRGAYKSDKRLSFVNGITEAILKNVVARTDYDPVTLLPFLVSKRSPLREGSMHETLFVTHAPTLFARWETLSSHDRILTLTWWSKVTRETNRMKAMEDLADVGRPHDRRLLASRPHCDEAWRLSRTISAQLVTLIGADTFLLTTLAQSETPFAGENHYPSELKKDVPEQWRTRKGWQSFWEARLLDVTLSKTDTLSTTSPAVPRKRI